MDLDINFFREFVILAETNSYSEASERLFISQSTLSKHIKNFELELGHPLFKRTTRKIELTPFGAKFLPYAEQIAKVQDTYTEQLLTPLLAGTTISVGITPRLFEHILTTTVNGFQERFPQYQVTLCDQDVPPLKKSLINKECDFIFIHDTIENDSDIFTKELLELDHFAAVFPPDHPFADRDSIALSELRDAQFLFLPEGTVVYDLSMEACRKAGFEPNIVFRSANCENIFHLVEKKKGIGIVAQNHLPPHDNVKLVTIEPPITTAVSVCFREDNLSAASKDFLNWVRKIFQAQDSSSHDRKKAD
ncbi:MAG: LysR family transcriptional regulator [Oscillospiraceae bacterium]